MDEQTYWVICLSSSLQNCDYSNEADKELMQEDNRMTLYCDPFLSIDSTAASKQIKFSNNSKVKGFCITIQGVTSTGKLIYYRRLFDSPGIERPEKSQK